MRNQSNPYLCHRCTRPADRTDSRGRPLCHYCDPLNTAFCPREVKPPPEPKLRADFIREALALLDTANPMQWVQDGDWNAAADWEAKVVRLLEEYECE